MTSEDALGRSQAKPHNRESIQQQERAEDGQEGARSPQGCRQALQARRQEGDAHGARSQDQLREEEVGHEETRREEGTRCAQARDSEADACQEARHQEDRYEEDGRQEDGIEGGFQQRSCQEGQHAQAHSPAQDHLEKEQPQGHVYGPRIDAAEGREKDGRKDAQDRARSEGVNVARTR